MRVSIVIPCFNRAALVTEAIESALANGEGAEIVVVDDGSTDASWTRILAFGDRVRAFRLPNGGVSRARNFGVDQSTGTHIKFLDSDDRLPPGAIAALTAAAHDAAPRRIVFGDARSIDADGKVIDPFGYGFADIVEPGPMPRSKLLSATMSPLLPLYPAETLREAGGFDPAYDLGEDQELAVRLMLAGHVFHRIPVIVAEVREHPGDRLSRTGTASVFDRQITLFSGIIRQLEMADPPLAADEASALAGTIWTAARDAARARCRTQAMRLFALATTLAEGTGAAPAHLRLLYRMFDPYRAERIIEVAKRIGSRRRFSVARGTGSGAES